MDLKVEFLGGVRFVAETRGHKVVCDQPIENGGEDSGMTPPEFLLAALGTCAGYYAVQYLKSRQLPSEGLTIRAVAGKAAQPARMDNFRISIDVPSLEDPRHREGVIRAAKSCIIHNTMLHSPSIEVVLADVEALESAIERHA